MLRSLLGHAGRTHGIATMDKACDVITGYPAYECESGSLWFLSISRERQVPLHMLVIFKPESQKHISIPQAISYGALDECYQIQELHQINVNGKVDLSTLAECLLRSIKSQARCVLVAPATGFALSAPDGRIGENNVGQIPAALQLLTIPHIRE